MENEKQDEYSDRFRLMQNLTMGNVVNARALMSMDVVTRTLVAFTSFDVSNVRLIFAAGEMIDNRLYHQFAASGVSGFQAVIDPETGRLVYEIPIDHVAFLTEGPRMEDNHWCLGKSITGSGAAKLHPFSLLRIRYQLHGVEMELLVHGYPDARIINGSVICMDSLAAVANSFEQSETVALRH